MQFNLPIDFLEYVEYSSWDNTVFWLYFHGYHLILLGDPLFNNFNYFIRSKHSISFTRSALTIGKDSPIITLHELLDSLMGTDFIHKFLGTLAIEYMVKGKDCWIRGRAFIRIILMLLAPYTWITLWYLECLLIIIECPSSIVVIALCVFLNLYNLRILLHRCPWIEL